MTRSSADGRRHHVKAIGRVVRGPSTRDGDLRGAACRVGLTRRRAPPRPEQGTRPARLRRAPDRAGGIGSARWRARARRGRGFPRTRSGVDAVSPAGPAVQSAVDEGLARPGRRGSRAVSRAEIRGAPGDGVPFEARERFAREDDGNRRRRRRDCPGARSRSVRRAARRRSVCPGRTRRRGTGSRTRPPPPRREAGRGLRRRRRPSSAGSPRRSPAASKRRADGLGRRRGRGGSRRGGQPARRGTRRASIGPFESRRRPGLRGARTPRTSSSPVTAIEIRGARKHGDRVGARERGERDVGGPQARPRRREAPFPPRTLSPRRRMWAPAPGRASKRTPSRLAARALDGHDRLGARRERRARHDAHRLARGERRGGRRSGRDERRALRQTRPGGRRPRGGPRSRPSPRCRRGPVDVAANVRARARGPTALFERHRLDRAEAPRLAMIGEGLVDA